MGCQLNENDSEKIAGMLTEMDIGRLMIWSVLIYLF